MDRVGIGLTRDFLPVAQPRQCRSRSLIWTWRAFDGSLCLSEQTFFGAISPRTIGMDSPGNGRTKAVSSAQSNQVGSHTQSFLGLESFSAGNQIPIQNALTSPLKALCQAFGTVGAHAEGLQWFAFYAICQLGDCPSFTENLNPLNPSIDTFPCMLSSLSRFCSATCCVYGVYS